MQETQQLQFRKETEEERTKQKRINLEIAITCTQREAEKERTKQEKIKGDIVIASTNREAEIERTKQEEIKRDKAVSCAKEATKQQGEVRKRTEALERLVEARALLAQMQSKPKTSKEWNLNELPIGDELSELENH